MKRARVAPAAAEASDDAEEERKVFFHEADADDQRRTIAKESLQAKVLKVPKAVLAAERSARAAEQRRAQRRLAIEDGSAAGGDALVPAAAAASPKDYDAQVAEVLGVPDPERMVFGVSEHRMMQWKQLPREILTTKNAVTTEAQLRLQRKQADVEQKAAARPAFQTKTDRVGALASREARGARGGLTDLKARGALTAAMDEDADGMHHENRDDTAVGADSEDEEGGEVPEYKRWRTLDPRATSTRLHSFGGKLRSGHGLGVFSAAYMNDGIHAVSSSWDGSVCLWNMRTRTVRRRYVGHAGAVLCARFNPTKSNRQLATCSRDGTVRLWKTRSAELIYTFATQFDCPVNCLAWTRNGKRLAAGGDNGHVIVWDVATAVECAEDPTMHVDQATEYHMYDHTREAKGHTGPLRGLVFSRDGAKVFSAGTDGVIKMWRLRGGKEHAMERTYIGHRGAVMSLDMSPDGSRIVSGGTDGTARVWSTRSSALLATMRGHEGPCYVAKFTAEEGGRRVISGGHDLSVVVWDSTSGMALQRLPRIHKSFVLDIAVRPDGMQFLSASGDRTLSIWNSEPASLLEQACYHVTRCCRGMMNAYSNLFAAAEENETKEEVERRHAMHRDSRRAQQVLGQHDVAADKMLDRLQRKHDGAAASNATSRKAISMDRD